MANDKGKNDVDAKAEIREAQREKMVQKRAEAEAKRFVKLNSELIKNREANSKEQGFIKNQLSTNAKKQLGALRDMTRPSSLIKAVGLASGSPFVAIMGSKLGDLIELDKEAKEARKTESQRLTDLLKKSGKSSGEIVKILEDTQLMAGANEDELFAHLSSLGFKDKETFDKFLEIKKAGDEKLIASNFDIVQGLKEKGVEEKDQAAVLRSLLHEQLVEQKESVKLERDRNGQFMSVEDSRAQREQLAEQGKDEDRKTAENQSESVQKLVAMTAGISESLKEMAEELGESKFGLGTIAGLIAAPIFILIGFFEGIGSQLKWLDDFSKGRLSKAFAPLKNFFTGLKDLKIFSKFPDIGKMFKTLIDPFVDFFKYIKGIANVGAKFGSQFGLIAKFAQGFGKLLGKLFLPFQIIMGAFDLITGFMEGYEADGIVGGIKGAFEGLIDGLIGGLVKMLAGGLDWVLSFLGFDQLGAAIVDGVNNIFEGIYNTFNGFIDIAIGIFTLDPAKIFGALTSIATSMIDIMFAPMDMFIGFIKDVFSFAGIDLPTFDVTEFLKGFVTDAISGVKNFFGFGDDGKAEMEEELKANAEEIKEQRKKGNRAFQDKSVANFGKIEVNGEELKGEKLQAFKDDAQARLDAANKERNRLKVVRQEIADKDRSDYTAKDFFGFRGDQSQLENEQEELALFSNQDPGGKIKEAARIKREADALDKAAVITQTNNNTSINSSTNNVVTAPNMSTGTDDRTFADAVMGA